MTTAQRRGDSSLPSRSTRLPTANAPTHGGALNAAP